MPHRILVVDDEPHIREVICFALDGAGMTTETARDGAEALKRFSEMPPDLIVLDIGMPETDGLEVCRQVRKVSDVPILFLSARDEEIDRVLGLEIGGDDYVTKPFSPRELVARVNVILRRSAPRRLVPEMQAAEVVRRGLRIDAARHVAAFEASELPLTATEFEIVRALASRPEMVFSREQIMALAYPTNIHVSDRTIDSHIRNIRAKFAAAGCESAIDTVHGVGFRIGRCEPPKSGMLG
ncbi:DNA-binding response regulator [Aliidongia dinghuensis]|uniref:DNA-binding response regulator n=1 Tax=Aliidongia dinghuensis TaxID=1867774 RepID=A0A8J2YTS7_9PROT|nr:response regulator transcription factor [Aliidongia dinghuensis]GGF19518.1 DNA-binding response regulator [Aliidongia dinghuensis]